jgi:hypothetical protein
LAEFKLDKKGEGEGEEKGKEKEKANGKRGKGVVTSNCF